MQDSKLAWFCLRSQLKHEHIAAAHLRQRDHIEVFVPQIRFKRKTRYGLVWVTEALFPNYLFARFDWGKSLRQIYHSPGVSEVVHFGSNWPVVPDDAIANLRTALGDNEIQVVHAEFVPGDEVEIIGGAFNGLQAVVTRIMPAPKRVAVLLDFLGRQTVVELDLESVIKQANERVRILPGSKPKPPERSRHGN